MVENDIIDVIKKLICNNEKNFRRSKFNLLIKRAEFDRCAEHQQTDVVFMLNLKKKLQKNSGIYLKFIKSTGIKPR